MTTRATLDPGELLEALGDVATVLSDHAAALDRLEQGSDWDDALQLDGSGAPIGLRTVGTSRDAERLVAGSSGGTDLAVGVIRATPGTDLARTVAGAVRAADAAGVTGFSDLADHLMRGANEAATGRAGRHLATMLGGLAETLRNADRLDAERFAIGLELGAERLAPSDDGAHAGGFPAVAARAADAALDALDSGAALADVIITAADEGLVELESGPVANPRLVERGVVDASAAGFLLMLDVLASVLTGEPLPAPPMDPVTTPADADHGVRGARYLVSCLIEPHDGCGIESANWLESLWFELGNVERFEHFDVRWDVAMATTQPGAAIEAIFDVGRPRDLRIVALPAAA